MPSPFLSLRRDEQGRIAERTLNLVGESVIRRYAYDSAGRLARVTDGAGGLLESYQYDHEGRRLADINPQRFRGERRYSYAAGDRLSQAGRVHFGHDAAGFRNFKVEGDHETRYQYEPSGLLLAVDLPNGRHIEYGYDAKGQRTEKRIDGRLVEAFRWLDPLRLEDFFDGTRWWRLAYLEGRTPVGVTNGDDSYLLLCDQVGTPLALATTDGHIVQAMQYDSFGNLLQVRGDAVRLPIGFAGWLFDADTGLTRFVWRDYDADTGRFTALDPMGAKGGDKDWYGYCVDDPVNRVDAWGLWSLFGFGAEEQKSGEGTTEQSRTARDDNPYCKVYPCDDNGTMQGDYKPIDIHPGAKPFLLDFSVPVPKSFTDFWGMTSKDDTKEIRVPLLPYPLVYPVEKIYERNKEAQGDVK